MNTRRIEFSVGVFVFVGLAALAFLAIKIGGGRFAQGETRVVTARFTNASGLKEGSTVRIAGVPVGAVTKVALKYDEMVALVSFSVDANVTLDDDTVAAVRSAGLIGEKFISIQPGSSGVPLKAGDVIVDTQSAVDLEDIIARFAFGDATKK